jgi:hypothetical protein
MKKLFICLAAVAMIRGALALPNFDPFANSTNTGGTTYDVGEALTNQFNNVTITNAWYLRGYANRGTLPTIAAGSLSNTNLPPSQGNSVSFVGATAQNACSALNVAAQAQATFYYSFLLKVTDLTAVSTAAANNPFVAFLDDPSTSIPSNTIARLGARLVAKKVDSLNYVLGVSKTATTSDFAYESTSSPHAVNETVFVVVAFERTASQTNVYAWINPPASSFGSNAAPAPTLTATSGTSALNVNGPRAFGILCQFSTAPSGVIDELRIATNDWAYVTGGNPAILVPPSSLNLVGGNNASFTVTARGTPAVGYMWIKNGTTILADGGNISGSTTSNLVVSAVTPGDAGNYVVVVTNTSGSVTSSPAILAVVDPAIGGQPQNRTDDYGATSSFTVTAAGTAPLSYQWRKNDADLSNTGNVSGATTSNLALSAVTYLDAGGYSVVVSNGLGNSVTSSVATLTVRDPAITSPPASRTNNTGTTAMFTVAAAGTPTLSYQWKHDITVLVNGGIVSGADTDTLTLTGVSPSDAGNYFAVVSGSASGLSVTSAPALLTVIDPVAIYAQPASRTVAAGNNVAFAVGVTGTSPSYQWRSNGIPISGATSASYALANVQSSFAANYSVVVTSVLNSVTSTPAVLTVSATVLGLFDTNLVVIRVGNGAQALTANGNSMFLDQFTGNGVYLNTLNIPDDGSTALITMGPNAVPSPSSVTGTGLSRSADGRFLVVAGYNTNLTYGAALHNATSQAVPRGIGLIDVTAQYTLPVSSTDLTFTQTFFRSAVADGTNNFWGAARTPGTYYFGFDQSPAMVQSIFSNMRAMAVFNGSIYCVSAVGGNNGVLKLDGMPPITGSPLIPAPLFSGSTATSDLEVSPNGNLIYVADDRNAPSGGIQRYEFDTNSSTWSLVYTLTNGVESGARYVTANFSGPNPVIYAITKEATDENNRIVIIEDTGAASVGTSVAAAGANQNFRGIRFGPSVAATARPTLSFTVYGSDLVLSWSGPYTLMTATNVAGPYLDVVPTATSPHTNSTSSSAQRYFGLRQN